MINKDLLAYLEELNPEDTLSVYMNEEAIEINSISLDLYNEIYLMKNTSKTHIIIKDLISQLKIIDLNKVISVRFLSKHNTMKDYMLVLKDNKLSLEKTKVSFETIDYYFNELEEDNDIDYEEELTFNLGKALESYFDIDEISFNDRFLSFDDFSIGIYQENIEIESFGKYSLYTNNVTDSNLQKFKKDILRYIETKDFSVFKNEGFYQID